ncbi:MAG: hypothetical protein AAGF19_06695 [Pseudomonadota bacterium]
MADYPSAPLTHSHHILDDGTVAFRCSKDKDAWPWLALAPAHPIIIQTLNYWAFVETSQARGGVDARTGGALTYSRWYSGKAGVGPIDHGIAEEPKPDESGKRQHWTMTFFDAEGRLVSRLYGSGVIFRERDFAAWRDEAKHKMPMPQDASAFMYAGPEALGVASHTECFLSPLLTREPPTAEALVARDKAFIPNHPYHGGSGDHVNAHQLADSAMQFAHLVKRQGRLRCIGGEMAFKHFVELDRPFTLEQSETDGASGALSLTVTQEATLCTAITLLVEPLRD